MLGRSKKISQSLVRTRQSFFGRVTELLGVSEVTGELWEELEELLIQADVGVKTTVELVERLQEQVNGARIRDAEAVKDRGLQVMHVDGIFDYVKPEFVKEIQRIDRVAQETRGKMLKELMKKEV